MDSSNIFVEEYILKLAERVGVASFFRSYQAGFTAAFSDPVISACDCAKIDGKSVRGCSIYEYIGDSSCSTEDSCPVYSFYNATQCPLKPFNETYLCKRERTCYTVAPYSSDQFRVCQSFYFVVHNMCDFTYYPKKSY